MIKPSKYLILLYDYFLIHGFEHSMSEIANGINLTKKTLHNRYITRDYLEEQILAYWKTQLMNRFREKTEFSNHPVETLLLLIYELELSIINEFPMYEKEHLKYHKHHSLESHFLFPVFLEIIQNGQQNGDFPIDMDTKKYTIFLIFNIIHLFFQDIIDHIGQLNRSSKRERISIVNQLIQVDYIEYLLSANLTHKGKNKLKEIDLNLLFIVH
ncbi:MAG TPA: hypothetical protein PLI77_00920 [Bacteroidales bacterium]|nr:hypothetical protein [Bacteroidales bacterium]